MDGAYEVLNPWAEADPIPLRGISPRLRDLGGRRIGLFINDKVAAAQTQAVVEQKLKERFADLTFSRFEREVNSEVAQTEDKEKYEHWVKGVDAVILAAGD